MGDNTPMFRLESDMTPIASQWMSDQGADPRLEFGTPWGICDIVGAAFDEDRVNERVRLRQRTTLGSARLIRLLHQVPEVSSISYDELMGLASVAFDAEEFRASIERFLKRRLIKRSAPGMLTRVNGWDPIGRVIAVELKLHRVSEVIEQARRNRSIADQSYAGLPEDIACRIAEGRQAIKFRSAGVGLLSVGRDGCEVLIPPSTNLSQLDRAGHTHCLERFWRSRPRASASASILVHSTQTPPSSGLAVTSPPKQPPCAPPHCGTAARDPEKL